MKEISIHTRHIVSVSSMGTDSLNEVIFRTAEW